MFLEDLLWARHCAKNFLSINSQQSYPTGTDEETKAQSSQETCPRSHSWWTPQLGFEPKSGVRGH